MKKNLSILGVTGSIGSSALNVCDNFSDDINLISLSTNNRIKPFLNILDKYKPQYAVIFDTNAMYDFFHEYETLYNGIRILSGETGLKKICEDKTSDIILNGICGVAGLKPSITILENGINLALANKESMVCAGKLLNRLSIRNKCSIIPVDSEHSAVYQLLNANDRKNIQNIYLTASGGPFLNLDKKNWNTITVEDALKHPTWKMGNKITIDSATMANKGLEVIEAHELFGFDFDRIKVLIHPQSLIHSMVECSDGEIYAQIGPNDMSLPIQNALFHPEMKLNTYSRFDFSKSITLELFPANLEKFRMLEIAYYCGKKGGLYPALYNYLNEYLVELFLSGKITFLQIEYLTCKSLDLFDKDDEIHRNEFSFDDFIVLKDKTEKTIKSIL
jgi:1-deoxy-D-xylulose-5-phosphate reductoisomerase